MSKYRKACEEANAVPKAENMFSKILLRLFPNIKKARLRSGEVRQYVYFGISFKERQENSELHPMTIQESLKYPCMLTTQTLSLVTLMMTSSVITNGNIVMKTINLNFTNQTWTLAVRGKDVCLSNYGISNQFSKTKSNLNEILQITSRLDICTGLELVKKKKIPVHLRLEEVAIRGDENTHEMRMRSRTCEQVLGWYCTGNSCRKCAKLVGKFNNESEDDVINLSKVDDEDLHKMFNSIFQGAFNMKTITDDKTINKMVSHKRLQVEILDEETSILSSFTKADLLILCMAYCLSVKVQKHKKQIIEALKPVILKCSDIPNVAVFNRPEDDSGVNIEDQIVTQGASESVSDSGSTQSSATEDQQKSDLKKTVKRKVSKGKGKCKKKAKKSVSCKFPCGVCSMECSHNVVGCDGCYTWFHADCIHVENLDELPDEWFCNTCKDEMENIANRIFF